MTDGSGRGRRRWRRRPVRGVPGRVASQPPSSAIWRRTASAHTRLARAASVATTSSPDTGDANRGSNSTRRVSGHGSRRRPCGWSPCPRTRSRSEARPRCRRRCRPATTGRAGEELDEGLVDDQGGRGMVVGHLGQRLGVEDDAGDGVGVGDDHQVGLVESGVDLGDGADRRPSSQVKPQPGNDRRARLGGRRQRHGHGADGDAGGDGAEQLTGPTAGDQLAGVDAEQLGVAVDQAGGDVGRVGLHVVGGDGAEGPEHGLGRAVAVDLPGEIEAGGRRPPATLVQGGGERCDLSNAWLAIGSSPSCR